VAEFGLPKRLPPPVQGRRPKKPRPLEPQARQLDVLERRRAAKDRRHQWQLKMVATGRCATCGTLKEGQKWLCAKCAAAKYAKCQARRAAKKGKA
jgi:hypothetical protein